jgi:hypothetical protein
VGMIGRRDRRRMPTTSSRLVELEIGLLAITGFEGHVATDLGNEVPLELQRLVARHLVDGGQFEPRTADSIRPAPIVAIASRRLGSSVAAAALEAMVGNSDEDRRPALAGATLGTRRSKS